MSKDQAIRKKDQTSNAKQKSNFLLLELKHLKWWVQVMADILSHLAGQTAATLLGRLYYNEGVDSKWMATLVRSFGFPIVVFLFAFTF